MKKTIIILYFFLSYINLFAVPFDNTPSQTLPFGDIGKFAVADFDLDGDLDCILLIPQGNVALGGLVENNKGTMQINSIFGFLSDEGANAIALGDINRDGYMDIALNITGNRLIVVRNDFGGFNPNAPTWQIPDTNQDIKDILFADFNNDNMVDLAVARSNGRSQIYQGNGTGAFSPALSLYSNRNTEALAAGDLDNDGDIDLVFANKSKSNIVVFNGFIGTSRVWTNKNPLYTTAVTVADVNNDDWLDIIFGKVRNPSPNENTNVIQIYTNNHNNAFYIHQNITNINTSWNQQNPFNISAGDIDNDKDIDLAINFSYPERGPGYIYTNENSYFYKTTFNQNDQEFRGNVELVDIDNDGDLEFFTSFVYENKSPLISKNPAAQFEGGIDHVYTFGQDLLLLQFWDKIVLGRIGKGGGTWKWEEWANYTNKQHNNIESVAIGDINGVLSFNDLEDYVVATRSGWLYAYTNASVHIPGYSYTNKFNLCWSNKVRDGYCANAMALGDLNGDGAPDLVYSLNKTNGGGNDTNMGIYIMFNYNNGFLTNEIHLQGMIFAGGEIYLNANSIKIDDLDKDGDNDIICGNDAPDLIYYNKGQGVFDESTSCYPEAASTKSIDLGDVDGDGDLDVIRGNRYAFTYLYNNNNGVISGPYWQSPTMNDVSDIKLFDVDHDGDLDLGVANYKNFYSFIMKNKGSFLGSTENDYLWIAPTSTKDYTGMILRDFDGDNDTDIFLGGGNQGGPTPFSNEIYEGLYSDYYSQAPNLPNTPTIIYQNWTNQGPTTVNELNDLTFNIIAKDNEGKGNAREALIRFQVSTLDGTSWQNASVSVSGSDMDQSPYGSSFFFIRTSPSGYTNRTIHWNALADNLEGKRFIMRIVVYPLMQGTGKILNSAYIYYMYGSFYINGAPNAFIVSPSDNANVSGKVKIFGAAFDYDLKKYHVIIQNSIGGTIVNYSNFSPVPPVGLLYEWDTTGLPSGNYNITLNAYDNLYPNPKTATRSVNLASQVENSPQVVAIYPTNNQQNIAANAPVIAKFSHYMNENTLRDGTMRVVDGQTALEGNVKYKSLVQCLIFEANPNLSYNKSHIARVESSFQDVLGNALGNDYIWNFKVDQGLPVTIENYFPKYEDVATNTELWIKYNVDMSGYTNFNDDTFYVQDIDGNKVSGIVSNFNPSTKTVTFKPTRGLKGSTLYMATVKKDIISEAVPYPFTWYFITQDTVIPQIVSTTPTSGNDFFNPKDSINIRFNKTMNVNMLQENIFKLTDNQGKVISGSLIYDLDTNDLIFTPDAPLQDLMNYSATVYSKFQDIGGHSLTSDYHWTFRTTKIISSAGGTLESLDKKIKLRIPKNALTSDTGISITKLDMSAIPSVTPNSKLTTINQAFSFEPNGLKFNKPITITLKYPDVNNNGIVDDESTGLDFPSGIDENKLGLFYYNPNTGSYDRIGGTVDPINNTLTAAISHFSIYGIFYDTNIYNENLDITDITMDARIFSPGEQGTVNINYNVKLKGEGKADIKLYNLAGRLIKDLAKEKSINQGSNQVSWDGKDTKGDIVHNRMYVILIHVTDSTGKDVTKTKTIVVME